MNKIIVLLSGTPSGKSKFDELARQSNWTWNVNPKSRLSDESRILGWDGVVTDAHHKFIAEYIALLNKYLGYEKKFIEEKISSFKSDDSQTKTARGSDKVLTRFMLIMHGVSKDLAEELQKEHGAFRIHITRRDFNTITRRTAEGNIIPKSDFVLYEDDLDFEEQVLKITEGL